MTAYDPFDGAFQTSPCPGPPADPWLRVSDHKTGNNVPAPEAGPTLAVTNIPATEGKVVVTLKGGAGYDAPWVVIHAATIEEALAVFSGDSADQLNELLKRSQRAAEAYAEYNSKPRAAFVGLTGTASAPRAAAPAEAQSAPAGSPPAPGPGWTFKSGVSKANGKPWKGWMPPRGSDERPIFF